jgi:chemotaxis family two-component system response regulator PixG
MPIHLWAQQSDLAMIPTEAFKTCWQYQLLNLWVAQQKITPEQVANLIRAVIIEVLFDIAQAMRATYYIKEDNTLSTQLALVDVHEAIAEVEQLWQVWHNDVVADYSPNNAPIIKQPENLRERTSVQIYQTLTKLLDGQHTLRDLGRLMKRDVLQVTRSLLPYIQLGVVELITIPDLPVPVSPPISETPATPAAARSSLVVCVDDSPLVCQTMESLLTAAGYRFVSVQDGLRAIAIILAHKPDVIFLDLIMPHTNGYEICSKLRQLSLFRNTPILILTGNDGIVDRVRAKLVGASDFLNKPVDAGIVLSVIRKHLEVRN